MTWSVHAKSKATKKSSSSTTTWLFVDIFPFYSFLEFSCVHVLVKANDHRKEPWFLCFHAIILPAQKKFSSLLTLEEPALVKHWADVFALRCWNLFNIEIFFDIQSRFNDPRLFVNIRTPLSCRLKSQPGQPKSFYLSKINNLNFTHCNLHWDLLEKTMKMDDSPLRCKHQPGDPAGRQQTMFLQYRLGPLVRY